MEFKNGTLAITLGAAMSLAPSGWAQSDSRVIAQGNVSGYETVKTPVFSLGRGEAVSLSSTQTRTGEAQPLIPELYDTDATLWAKTGEEEKEPFHWSAPKEGQYYMRIRNVTDVPTHYEVRAVLRGRRGPVTPVANFAEVRVYYATNRKPTGDTSPAVYFGGEPADGNRLSLGEATVSVPRDLVHHMGELEGPSVFRIFNISLGPPPIHRVSFWLPACLLPPVRGCSSNGSQNVSVLRRESRFSFSFMASMSPLRRLPVGRLSLRMICGTTAPRLRSVGRPRASRASFSAYPLCSSIWARRCPRYRTTLRMAITTNSALILLRSS
jgi:hypothetical protein